MVGYRLSVGLGIAAILVAQRWLMVHDSGPHRVIWGCLLSIAFLLSITEFATLVVGRKLKRRTACTQELLPIAVVLAIASVLLALNLFPKQLGGLFGLLRRSPPLLPLVMLIGWWTLMIGWVRRRGGTQGTLALALSGLVLGTRLLVLENWPFERLDGDMLPVIDRALDALSHGIFPYDAFPAPMPYLPGTFLIYAPAKYLGWDLRVTNLVLDLLSVVLIVFLSLEVRRLINSLQESRGPEPPSLRLGCR